MRLTADLRMIRHSGIGRYLRNLFPLLLPQLNATHIRVLSKCELVAGAPWLSDPRIEFVETSASIYSPQEQLLALTGAYKNTDLLWVPHYNAPLFYRGKMLVTFHDVAPLAIPEILSNNLKRAYAKLLIEHAARHAAAILCVSSFTRSELITRLAVPAEKITVTPLGLDSDWLHQPTPEPEPTTTPYLLYVGNVKPNKNLSLLLKAFASVQDRLPHRLVLAGRMQGFGTNDEAVLQQAKSLGDRVTFTGEIDDAKLRQLYASASALILPSLYEGFGLPLLEAMQLGCPVLSSSAGSLPEVGGDAALYFDPQSVPELAACLLQTLDPALMAGLRERGLQRVHQFSFDRCASQTATVINRLLT